MSLLHWGTVGVLSLGLLGTAACGDDGKDSEEEAPVGPATGALCDSTLTYEKDIAPFMTKYCISCHDSKLTTAAQRMNSPSDHNFETEVGVRKELPHIDQEAGSGPKMTNMAMPVPSSGFPLPTVAERQKLSAWIACQPASD
ncbi:MAG: hypothetical protein JWN48_950 [Myxococcaceae bacterium]|nr:hypothetical protein [Myxococcaceae bacterium]